MLAPQLAEVRGFPVSFAVSATILREYVPASSAAA